jgi:Leucine-rich repeat (LRR) protein
MLNLESLDMSDNLLEAIPARNICRMPRLQRLVLKGNPLAPPLSFVALAENVPETLHTLHHLHEITLLWRVLSGDTRPEKRDWNDVEKMLRQFPLKNLTQWQEHLLEFAAVLDSGSRRNNTFAQMNPKQKSSEKSIDKLSELRTVAPIPMIDKMVLDFGAAKTKVPLYSRPAGQRDSDQHLARQQGDVHAAFA